MQNSTDDDGQESHLWIKRYFWWLNSCRAVDATLRYLNSIEFAEGVRVGVNFKSFKKLFLQMV